MPIVGNSFALNAETDESLQYETKQRIYVVILMSLTLKCIAFEIDFNEFPFDLNT